MTSAPTPTRRVLVFLHGHDDQPEPYVAQLRALLPDGFAVEAPRGPRSVEGSTAGWFDYVDGEPDPTQVAAALAVITDAVHQASVHHRVPLDRIVLGGFSQGGAMALAWVLGEEGDANRITALMVVAGWLPDVAGLSFDLDRAAGLPVLFAHGDADEVVPPPMGRSVARALEGRGAQVTFSAHPGAHELAPAARLIAEWLRTLPLA